MKKRIEPVAGDADRQVQALDDVLVNDDEAIGGSLGDPRSSNSPVPNGADDIEIVGERDPLNNRFELIKCIGAGGMGIMYKALDRHRLKSADLDPCVAIKVLKTQLRSDQNWLKILQQEARICQTLVHPNIVRVYDFHRDGPTAYLAMEYLHGEPLTGSIRSEDFRGMSAKEALKIINDMGNALAFSHGRGIIHCDFKPANVFLTRTGETKLIDFGLAKVFGDSARPHNDIERTVSYAVTPGYASPDILEQREPDPRDDLYSLACTAYELLTGEHPFDYKPATEARDAGLRVEHRDGLNRSQWKALQHALAFDRNKRTPKVEQFLEELNTRTWLPNPTFIAAGIAVVAVVAGLTVVLMKDRHWESGEKPITAKQMSSGQRHSSESLDETALSRSSTLETLADQDPSVKRHEQVGQGQNKMDLPPYPGRIRDPEGFVLARIEYFDEVVTAYRRILQIEPTSEVAIQGLQDIGDKYAQLVRMSWEQGDSILSSAVVRQGLNVIPKHSGLLSLKGEIENARSNVELDASDRREVQRWIEQAEEHLEASRFMLPVGENAVAAFKKVLQLDPNNQTALRRLNEMAKVFEEAAQEKLNDGKVKEGILLLKQGLMISPKHPRLLALQEVVSSGSVNDAGR